ncbi:hypothetical protein [Mycobacterium sp. SMC-11]|uniref:hypothetical protein n=1 Tax=Mycobacterium sp. SMC-11 TaxID=3385969 RepID=UPI00390C55E3
MDAQFSLGAERLAWPVDAPLGEIDYPQIFASPAKRVVDTLRDAPDVLALCLPTALGAEAC